MSKIPSFAGHCDTATGQGASNFPRPRVAQSIHVQHYPIPTGTAQQHYCIDQPMTERGHSTGAKMRGFPGPLAKSGHNAIKTS